ncbi:MAG: glycosyltransferase family 2 protein [Nanoarchaeota archaeon]|nr:glycosyltransferase family 2 protein [Nanoarchaeota archaeon]
MKDVTILIPVLNEEKTIEPLVDLIREVMKKVTKNYDILFVDDGSRDRTFYVLKKIHEKYSNVKIIKFRRNFGKAAALSAGFKEANSKYIITMDGDLQDDPREIPRFLKKLGEGFDLVSGWKRKRRDVLAKTLPSKFFNWLTAKLTRVNIHDFNCGFKAYKTEVVKGINLYGELHRYIPALVHWQGYNVGEIIVRHHSRRFGKSKYGIERLVKGFLDLITVKYLTTYIKRPLHFFGLIGLSSSFIGSLIGLYLIIEWCWGEALSNRPLLLLAVLMVVVGIQLISLGLIGELIVSNSKSQNNYNVEKKLK